MVKPHWKLSKDMLFHQDNAPAHMEAIVIAVAAINDCGFELIQHFPYSNDLTPSDVFLFPKLKKVISGTHFQSDDDVRYAVENFLDS